MDRSEPAVTRMILVKTVGLKTKKKGDGGGRKHGNMDIYFTWNCKQERTKKMREKLEGRTLQ